MQAKPASNPIPLPSDFPKGVKLLHDPLRNKGTAFNERERDALALRGLLPPRVLSQDMQVLRVLENLDRKPSDLEKYLYLVDLQDRNETLFYRVLVDHMKDLMPLVYTPTVGKACQAYGHVFRRPRGLFVSSEDRGRVARVLANWPHKEARVVVVTDGERILGLGDLGAHGMGIPVGKLALYTACAGIPPQQCLPVTLDVGTDNKELLRDPLYVGLPRTRLRGAPYDEIVDELLGALAEAYPKAIIQLEDFGNANAFRILEAYRDRMCLFDDDIQGTGSVVLAGIYSSLRITGGRLADQRFLFYGAGEAAIGIANMLVAALEAEGMGTEEARRRCWLFDSKGLVVARREDLVEHKRPFAHEHEFFGDFSIAVEAIRPTALIGVSGVPGAFTAPVLQVMAAINERPVIFALSNPTVKAECTAQQAYASTLGQAVFASGSPFDPVDFGGRTFVPGQANNAYIFPGVGLGVLMSEARRVTDEMFFVAARALAGEVTRADLGLGRVFPPLSRIRDVSARIAAAVATVAYERNLAQAPRPDDLQAHALSMMYEPDYREYV